jgi:hypothetical protein
VYAFAYFIPISKLIRLFEVAVSEADAAVILVVETLGDDVIKTQLHAVPPFASAFALCIMMAWLSGRTNLRLPFVVFSGARLITGLEILLTVHAGSSVRYLGINLVCMGALEAAPKVFCCFLMNLKSHRDRSI